MGSKAKRKELREKKRNAQMKRDRRAMDAPSFNEYIIARAEKESPGFINMARKLTPAQRTILGV